MTPMLLESCCMSRRVSARLARQQKRRVLLMLGRRDGARNVVSARGAEGLVSPYPYAGSAISFETFIIHLDGVAPPDFKAS